LPRAFTRARRGRKPRLGAGLRTFDKALDAGRGRVMLFAQ